jgi:hypothetical protein
VYASGTASRLAVRETKDIKTQLILILYSTFLLILYSYTSGTASRLAVRETKDIKTDNATFPPAIIVATLAT